MPICDLYVYWPYTCYLLLLFATSLLLNFFGFLYIGCKFNFLDCAAILSNESGCIVLGLPVSRSRSQNPTNPFNAFFLNPNRSIIHLLDARSLSFSFSLFPRILIAKSRMSQDSSLLCNSGRELSLATELLAGYHGHGPDKIIRYQQLKKKKKENKHQQRRHRLSLLLPPII